MRSLFVGVDFHKRTCTFVVLNKQGKQTGQTKKVDTKRLVTELRNIKDCVVGIESSGGVNHMVDLLKDAGLDVRIINSNKARAIGYGGKKTDKKDAMMIASLLRADFVPEVSHRSKETREMSLLVTAREHLVTMRTSMVSHVRGLLREHGITIKTGIDNFYAEAEVSIQMLSEVNPVLAEVLKENFETLKKIRKQAVEIQEKIEAATSEDKRIKSLREIPGVGVLGAYLMVAVVDDISRFPNPKSFASYLGLVPREHSSGDSKRLGSVTKSGNSVLRRYLIHGARAVLSSKNFKHDPNYHWAKRIEDKKGKNKAAVALAHKLARTCFAMLRDGESYKFTKSRQNQFKTAA